MVMSSPLNFHTIHVCVYVHLQSTKDTESSVNLLQNSSQKEAVGKIFDKILIRKYPDAEYISLDDLLQWDLWPNYFLIYREPRTYVHVYVYIDV
jgi:hypothetical protein